MSQLVFVPYSKGSVWYGKYFLSFLETPYPLPEGVENYFELIGVDFLSLNAFSKADIKGLAHLFPEIDMDVRL